MTESFVSQMMEFDADLFSAAMKLCKYNEADAADLLQDTYIRGFKSSHSFTPGTNLRAWLHTILRNQYINQYRRLVKFRKYVDGQIATGGIDSKLRDQPAPTQDTVAQSRCELEHVLDLIREHIPETFFKVLVLVDLQDKSYKEAAEILDVPVGTIMSRLYRARKASRALLMEDYESLTDYISPEVLNEYREEVA